MLPMVVVRDAIGATAHGDLVSALELLQKTEVHLFLFPLLFPLFVSVPRERGPW
jgi:hypothetical protein